MIARDMTFAVLVGSLVMFGVAVGCGERSSTPSPEPTTGLPASSGEGDEAKPGDDLELVLDVPDTVWSEPIAETPEPEVPSTELFEVDGVALRRLVIARGVEGREPVGASSSFPAGERLYAFLDAQNDTDEDVELYVTFEGPEGRSVGHVILDVPAHSPRWRTWAYSRVIDREGEWEAVVTTMDGQEVGRARFQVDG